MKTIDLYHTQPPSDLLMPALPQMVTTTIYGIVAVMFIAYSFYLAYRHKSAMPVLFILGAMLTLFFEPIVDLLGNAIHPQIGQYNIITTNGHPVPWAVFVGYVWYFAAAPLLCYDKLVNRTLTACFIWKIFAATVIGAATVEQIPLFYDLWVYYGYQSFKIGFMPIWWIFANSAAVLVPFILIYKLYPLLKGWRQAIVIGLIPMGAFMGHSAAGWPMYSALGMDTATFPHGIIQLASLCTMGLSILVVWVFIKVADID